VRRSRRLDGISEHRQISVLEWLKLRTSLIAGSVVGRLSGSSVRAVCYGVDAGVQNYDPLTEGRTDGSFVHGVDEVDRASSAAFCTSRTGVGDCLADCPLWKVMIGESSGVLPLIVSGAAFSTISSKSPPRFVGGLLARLPGFCWATGPACSHNCDYVVRRAQLSVSTIVAS
jgi:hypothetical protein